MIDSPLFETQTDLAQKNEKKPGSNVPEYTVSEIGDAVKRTIENAYGYVRIRGEVSQPKLHGSGHLYLRLKDDQAVIDSVCWRGAVSKLSIMPEEGMEVICTGRITTYKGRSQYQLVIENIELAGVGALMKMLEALKNKLAAEGLFDASRKKKLPYLPKTIGVLTSPTGAVIRDILHRIQDRFPAHILLWPVAVQGEGAAEQIIKALQGFQQFNGQQTPVRPDLLILARGGGSFEDLMAFNDERLIREIAACEIPIISAIGHETDTTLCDFVSDLRAPTPTGAAEMAVPVRLELHHMLQDKKNRLMHLSTSYISYLKSRLEALHRGLVHPRSLIENYAQRLDDRSNRLKNALLNFVHIKRNDFIKKAGHIRHPKDQIAFSKERFSQLKQQLDRNYRFYIQNQRQSLSTLLKLLQSYSFERTLDRGFALVTNQTGDLVTTIKNIKKDQPYMLTLKDGHCNVVSVDKNASASVDLKKESKKNKAIADTHKEQGNLFD